MKLTEISKDIPLKARNTNLKKSPLLPLEELKKGESFGIILEEKSKIINVRNSVFYELQILKKIGKINADYKLATRIMDEVHEKEPVKVIRVWRTN